MSFKIAYINSRKLYRNNDHFIFIGGDLNEDLTLPSHSKRKEELVCFIDEYKLSTVPVGPTFIHPNGKDCSTIDYLIFRDTSGVDVNITCCNTLASNTSDHHPIKCVTNISAIEDGSAGKLCVAEDEVIVRVNWEKVEKDLYAAMVDKEFQNPERSIDISTIHEVDSSVRSVNVSSDYMWWKEENQKEQEKNESME